MPYPHETHFLSSAFLLRLLSAIQGSNLFASRMQLLTRKLRVMNASTSVFLSLFLVVLALPAHQSHAADEPADTSLHVLRPTIHAEQDKAELCLEFDHGLDASDLASVASNVRLQSSGKTLPMNAQNISVTNSLLCLSSLDHRKEYRVTITDVRGSKGEKLANPYSLSFNVPDRQPALAFGGSNDGIMRWHGNDPYLRVMNVMHVHLELFRVTDLNAMVDAWRQRLQTTLAPSESATYAQNHGQSIWQDTLTLDTAPNQPLSVKIPSQTRTGTLASGLYLLVVTATKTISMDSEPDFMPLAAQWLLRSDLKIRAVRGADGYYALTENADASAPAPNVHLLIQDRDQKSLTDGRSDADGIAPLPLSDDTRDTATLLVGQTDNGDIDFADLSAQDRDFTLPNIDASLSWDKAFYVPGGNAAVTLAAHDLHGHAITMKGSNLQILRPDAERSFYANIAVPDLRDGTINLIVPTPVIPGLWPIVWQQNDGHILAEGKVRVTSNPGAPRLELKPDRAMAGDDGEVNLTLKSLTQDHTAAPYITGRVTVSWVVPDHVFPGWEAYHFGNTDNISSQPARVASFITDDKGAAFLHLTLAPPADGAPLHAAVLSANSDPVAGAIDPAPLTLPIKPKDYIVGIKPFAAGGRFAENSLARFDVIALDGQGNRRALDDLTYQIYEEGRSFEWFQDEGRWNFKLQQQQRPVNGGALPIRADGPNRIDWPVTAGNYRLDITSPSGTVVVRLPFSAGWGMTRPEASDPKLSVSGPGILHTGEDTAVHFTLDQPSMVTAIVADDRVRKIIHQVKQAGPAQFSLTPQKDWGRRISIWIDTGANSASGRLVVPCVGETPAPTSLPSPTIPPTSPAADFAIMIAPPPYLKTGDSLALSLTLKNSHATDGTYRYNLTASSGLKLSGTGAGVGSIALRNGQSKTVSVPLMATQAGAHDVKLEVTGPHAFHFSQTWPVSVVSGDKKWDITAAQPMDGRRIWALPHDKGRAKTEDALLFLSPEPLYDFPLVLQSVLEANAFTTVEIAGHLETLRLWRDVILAAGLMSDMMFEARRRDLLLRLLARQKADGSFPSLSDDESELINSSAALIALAPLSQMSPMPDGLLATKPAVDQTVTWLHDRLSNTWFDEKERVERAKAYAALAIADRLDMASLHYFSDTSAGKDLPALASVQLAAAFALNGDRDASQFWLNKANIQKGSSDIAPPLLTLLAQNPFIAPHDLLRALEKLSHDNAQQSASGFGERVAFLRALWNVTNRAGTWNVTLNNVEQNAHTVLVAGIPERNPSFTVRNPMDRPLFLVTLRATPKAAPPSATLTRHIYRMNGSEMSDADTLDRDQVYLIALEGPWVGDNDSFLGIHDDLSPAMHPEGCILDTALTASAGLSWLKGFVLTTPTICEKSVQSMNVLLTRGAKNKGPWRIAYLAKADNGGNFKLAPPTARSIYGHHEILIGHSDMLRIR
jgi:uncharacterized protein YfaS (alpha-2-macroglobulin family)